MQPSHFTYQSFDVTSDLHQGDILLPKRPLVEILKEVHPHFLDSKYNAFMVLTQTCDLVRRGGNPCKSRYINLSVVRPLEDVLFSLLDKVCKKAKISGKVLEGVYLENSYYSAKNLLKRIIDQNEQALGLFFLYPDAAIKIVEDSVVLLQVSIALRADEHYDELMQAREGRLSVEFQSKLGWLMGNLFSRVATPDWPERDMKQFFGKYLRGGEQDHKRPFWIPEENVNCANSARVQIEGLDSDTIIEMLKQHEPKPKIDIGIERVRFALKETYKDIPDEILEKVQRRLKADIHFESLFK